MLIAERHSRLQQLLASKGMASLEALAIELGVSQSTVRRDLELLQSLGVVRKIHGGAIWMRDETGPGTRPYAFDQRLNYQFKKKRAIAAAARLLVSPGQTVLIDGGTTTYFLAQELAGQSLQIVTNSLPIANLYQNDEHVELIVVGGLMYPRYGVLLGPAAESMLSTIHVNTLILSVAGLHGRALYNQNVLLVQSEQQMMRQAQRVVLLLDSSKFGQKALVKLCELDEIDVVVTDNHLPPEQRDIIAQAGCELILAEENEAESPSPFSPDTPA